LTSRFSRHGQRLSDWFLGPTIGGTGHQEQPVKFLADVSFSRGLQAHNIVPHLDGCGLSFSVMGRENGVTRNVRQVGNGIVN
jgi:hypothetical protein